HNGRVRVSERPATCVFRRCRLCVTVDCMNETLTIRLGEKLAYALSQEARRTGLAKGEIARQALEARLLSTGKPSAMARQFACIVRMTELTRDSQVITVDRDDFAAYRRNGRDLIPVIVPPTKAR